VNSDGAPIWLDVRSAQAAAKAKKKMIIADYFTDWCGWCKVLDRRTLSSPEVQAYLAKNFVCMKVNAQDGAAGEELAKQFDVRGFPTIMIFAYNGRKLASFDGFREPQDFLAAIKEGLGPRAPK
jgi:thioredoxin-related protein